MNMENFDVFMELLVEELLELREGVPAYDILKDVGSQEFTLRRMLLWTIHDYPRYGTVGGFAHQGYAGCSYCGPELEAEQALRWDKVLVGLNHIYRLEAMKGHVNGEVEN